MTVKIIDFPKIVDPRGSLTFLQNPQFIPFEIQRVYWVYNVPLKGGGFGYAYKQQDEVIIALNGSFEVVIKSKDESTQKFTLIHSHQGLYVPALTWRHIENFSSNSICLHLSSQKYSADDYIKDFETLKKQS